MFVMVRVRSGLLQVGHLVGGAGRVEDLVEGGGVDADPRIVAGEGLLGGHVEHLLHDVDLVPDPLDVWNDQPEAGPQRAREAAEALDRVGVALRNGANTERDCQDREEHEGDDEDVEAE
jgi:hypothetical protein